MRETIHIAINVSLGHRRLNVLQHLKLAFLPIIYLLLNPLDCKFFRRNIARLNKQMKLIYSLIDIKAYIIFTFEILELLDSRNLSSI